MMASETPKDLHDAAMEALTDAKKAKGRGELGEWREHQEKALELEGKAAMLLRCDFSAEPTRGVLFRSAGWMAFDLNHYTLARQYASEGLAGSPPEDIAGELRDLLALAIGEPEKEAPDATL